MGEYYRAERTALVVLFAASAFAIFSAYANPARGYEVSIYRATPTFFWVVVGSSILISVPIAFCSESELNSRVALAAVGWSVVLVGLLPIIRGYRYLGTSDALSHLGMARKITTSSASVPEIFYPLLSLLSGAIRRTAGISVERSVLLLLPVFTIVFIVFVPLLVRNQSESGKAPCIAVLTACLVLPINQVSRAGTFYQPYPTLFAIFLTPLVLYLLFRSIASNRTGFVLGTVIGILALILAHSQQAFNFILIGATVSLSFRIYSSGHWGMKRPRRVISLTTITGIIFWKWVQGFDPFERSVSGLLRSVVDFTGSTGDVSGAGSSLAQLGGSIEELFVKLFLLSAIFCGIGGLYGVVLLSPNRVLPDKLAAISTRASGLERGLTLSLVPVLLLFGFYMAFSSQYFRHLGFIMMVISILAPLGMRHIYELYPNNRKNISAILSVLFVVCLLITVPVIHLSPYIYQPTGHVSDSEMVGYASPIEWVHEGSGIHYLRTDPDRYYDARYSWQAPPPFATHQVLYERSSLPVDDPNGEYYVLSEADYEREVGLYDELYVSESELDGMGSSRTVSTIYSNGNVEWYIQDGGTVP